MIQTNLESAYQFCQNMAESHYENFPVASILLPKRLRRPISVIYAFARTADDFADEGDASQQHRLDQLNDFNAALSVIKTNNYRGNNPIFIALADVIIQHQLPIKLFEDLLDAFKQDVVKNRYATFDEVLDYCTRSANPVGRLLLHLVGQTSDEQLKQSDAVCTALQLINFYQDIVQDYTESDRIYIPQDELAAAELKYSDLINPNSQKIAPLIRSLYQRTELIMAYGAELGTHLSGRMGWEIRAMTLGGITTLKKLTLQDDGQLLNRPRLSKIAVLKILLISSSKIAFRYAANKSLNLKH
ncbi:MAG: squalene synthase HpnC [Methylophagaceae bacterium]